MSTFLLLLVIFKIIYNVIVHVYFFIHDLSTQVFSYLLYLDFGTLTE